MVVFEDEPDLQALLAIVLKAEGFAVQVEGSGAEARRVAWGFHPDLAIIDVRLRDDVSGFEVARDLRAVAGDVPIVFLTGADSLEERLTGFEVGADDYVVKPCDLPELVARIRAVLRRSGRVPNEVACFADVALDAGAHTVARGGELIDLTATEFSLLQVFLRRPRVVIGKGELLNEVWGYSGYDPNLVEVHVSSLRRKLEAHGPRLIHTVRSVGYALRDALLPMATG